MHLVVQTTSSVLVSLFFFFFSSRRRHTRFDCDWSSDVCSSDLAGERNYVQLEPENVREAMQREIATINPDPAYFRSFPDAQVMVNGRAAERVLLAERAYAPPAAAEEDEELVDTTGENPVPVPFVSPNAFRGP